MSMADELKLILFFLRRHPLTASYVGSMQQVSQETSQVRRYAEYLLPDSVSQALTAFLLS